MTAIRTIIMRNALFLAAAFLALAPGASAQVAGPDETFATATVTEIVSETDASFADIDRTVQVVRLRVDDGPEAGRTVEVENGILGGREDMRLAVGERVVLETLRKTDGEILHLVREKYRLPSLLWLTVAFVGLAVLLGGMTGVTSVIGLGVSILVLIGFVIPRIVAGSDPLLVSLLGAVVIACTSLYLAHGFSKRTSVALLSTLVTLGISTLLALLFVHAGKLFGMGSEESMFLQMGALGAVNLRGLLLGGIVIGCLGVLDDITTAQTATIDEISKANPRLSSAQLRKAGFSVGREHIASLINTLALAYVGSSFPLLLLFEIQSGFPLWVTLNGEFLAEEIVRTLVGSATLLFAVPISTWLAAALLRGGGSGASGGHSHAHSHAHALHL